MQGRGNQRSGERLREFGRGGVVWVTQVVEMNVDGPRSVRSAVKVERDLVRAALVLRLLLRACGGVTKSPA